MLITPYRFIILLSAFNCPAALPGVTTESDGQSDNLSTESHGTRRRIGADERSAEERATVSTTQQALGRSFPRLASAVLASETTGSNARGKRRNPDVTSAVDIAGGSLIRGGGTAPIQSSVASSSTLDGLVATRHSKHRRRRRCKSRAGCVRSGSRNSTTVSTADDSNDSDDEARNDRPNDHRSISRQETRHRNMEKQLLLANRSLALFRQDLVVPAAAAGEPALGHVVDPSSREIGDILADARSRRPQVATETLMPRISLKRTEKQGNRTAVGSRTVGKRVTTTVTKYEKPETADGETEVTEAPSSSEATLNGPDGRSLLDTSQTPSSDHPVGDALEEPAKRYESLKYEFNSTEEKSAPGLSRYERKYELGKTAHPQGNGNGDSLDSTVPASMYQPADDRTVIHESLAAPLSRLFDTLENTTAIAKSRVLLRGLDATRNWLGSENSANDLCQKWLNSKDKLEKAFLGPLVYLPACPCQYPSCIFYDDKIWDEKQHKYFRWRDVNGDSERMDVYKPGATYCVRSLLSQGSGHAAAQHCCYDRQRRLLTRGSGAGTPNFVSPEISAVLHERIDVLPWRLCKGDFSRFNRVRPPNNDNRCETNPDDDEYRRQINDTKYY